MRDIIFIASILAVVFAGVWFFDKMGNLASGLGPVQLLIFGCLVVAGLVVKIWKDDKEFGNSENSRIQN